jgi:hypothetical protein
VPSLLTEQAHAARNQYVEKVGVVDERRADIEFRLHDIRRGGKSDPRAAMREPLAAQRQLLAAERDNLYQELTSTMQELLDQAAAADAAWRSGNEQGRDRRIVIDETSLTIPQKLLLEAPDPLK